MLFLSFLAVQILGIAEYSMVKAMTVLVNMSEGVAHILDSVPVATMEAGGANLRCETRKWKSSGNANWHSSRASAEDVRSKASSIKAKLEHVLQK